MSHSDHHHERCRGSSSDMYDMAWSPDASFLIVGCVDNTARMWDVNESKIFM